MTPRVKKPPLSEKLLRDLANLANDAGRARFLKQRKLYRDSVVQQLNEVVRTKLRSDTRQALALVESAISIARRLRNQEALGRGLRSKANALQILGDNQKALKFHDQAIRVFRRIHNAEEEARTLIPSIQSHILLGEYDKAFEAADSAKQIFERLGDQKRIAHVGINVGNIYHRQDRFEEGLACYERAYEALLPLHDSEGLAVALYNMAVCLITMNDFPRALASYQRARDMCVQHGMTLLVTQADYNIAYLYYLRGEYSRAIEMLRATREACEKNGDAYVLALCYLDLSEIYLELNLSAEARETAHEGYLRFQKLGMGYEEAKCQANEAMALCQLGKTVHSLELFAKARPKFVREKNLVWPWLIDLYQAVVLYDEGRLFEARRLCSGAAGFFDTSLLPGKAVLCHLLAARISLRSADLVSARADCARALNRLASLEAPVLRHQAEFLMAQIQQATGDLSSAYQSCQKAREALETLRSSLRGEELKIAFMKNRLEVYECLVELCLSSGAGTASAEESFGYMELAKSRSLAELLVQHGRALPPMDAGQSGLVRRIREMREELNWYYRRIEIEQLRGDEPSPKRIDLLQKQALAQENELLRALRELPSQQAEQAAGVGPAVASLETIRDCLPPETALIEYFSVRDQLIAAVVTREGLEIVPITPISRVVNLLRLLHFQISKFRLGAEYIQTFGRALLDAAQAHLRQLDEEVITPVRGHLRAKHLVIVPHGVLHYLPFHALFDGAGYLIDSFTVSYAPSATVFALCQRKASAASGPPLVLGVPDAQAPLILDEVRSVAGILPGAELIVGAPANEAVLRDKGAHSKLIHIATHGNFRQDNPMFSGIRLGGGYLNLYDLYQLKLDAELVALSGCATGLNVVSPGDELLGLIRGLLYAGAQSLLLTLWDVHDRSTADFMTGFYRRIGTGEGKASAVRGAMLELRERYPHPYYWAPFTLIGKVLPV
ncbi:MAG TPA: CHAT domain-containing tetratricopeptide repeat protein [Candidatus Acidoferrales bacterium]|nr:CHAT domain-containing tetratricopeptide repeat protein [Candidatus Acidoferrales bacterium]